MGWSVRLRDPYAPPPPYDRRPHLMLATPPNLSTKKRTHADAAADREREWINEAQTTQARVKKQAKIIEKMQLQAGALLFDETGGV